MQNSSILFVVLLLLVIGAANHFTVWSAVTEGNITASVIAQCNLQLGSGWNYISLCAQPVNASVAAVLQNLSYRYVMVWNASSQEFEVYSPRASSPPFNSFDTNYSYFVLYDSATPSTLAVTGAMFNDTNISMLQGWNPPTYPYIFISNLSCYLSSIASKYRYVMKWNTSAQDFLIYSPRAAQPQFTTIARGEGQFISVTDPSGATLRYNKTACEA